MLIEVMHWRRHKIIWNIRQKCSYNLKKKELPQNIILSSMLINVMLIQKRTCRAGRVCAHQFNYRFCQCAYGQFRARDGEWNYIPETCIYYTQHSKKNIYICSFFSLYRVILASFRRFFVKYGNISALPLPMLNISL